MRDPFEQPDLGFGNRRDTMLTAGADALDTCNQ
jgi:hypothetical protein